MFVSSFMTFMTIGGFPSFVEDMKVIQTFNLLFLKWIRYNFVSSSQLLVLVSLLNLIFILVS